MRKKIIYKEFNHVEKIKNSIISGFLSLLCLSFFLTNPNMSHIWAVILSAILLIKGIQEISILVLVNIGKYEQKTARLVGKKNMLPINDRVICIFDDGTSTSTESHVAACLNIGDYVNIITKKDSKYV